MKTVVILNPCDACKRDKTTAFRHMGCINCKRSYGIGDTQPELVWQEGSQCFVTKEWLDDCREQKKYPHFRPIIL